MTPMLSTFTPKEISDEIRYFLSTGKRIKVLFKKKDGTEREAFVTTNQEYIPHKKLPKYVRSVPAGMVVMYDLEKKDWISFHESQALSYSEFH
jgi:hypothetical protein